MSYMCGAMIKAITPVNTISGINRIGKKVAPTNKIVRMKVFISVIIVMIVYVIIRYANAGRIYMTPHPCLHDLQHQYVNN